MDKQKKFDLDLFFAALADPTRRRIINLIAEEEVCVCFLVEVFETNQPKISRHLACLKKAGLVDVRRDWKWSYYKLRTPENTFGKRFLDEFLLHLKDDAEMQRERAKLKAVCCSTMTQIVGSLKKAVKT